MQILALIMSMKKIATMIFPTLSMASVLLLLAYSEGTVPPSASHRSHPIIGGQGSWKFQYRPDLANLPQSAADNIANGHGLVLNRENHKFYFTWQSKSVESTTYALASFDSDAENVRLLGSPGPIGLAAGTPHGLRTEHDKETGSAFLYHANNNQRVTKTTSAGEIIWSTSFSDWNVSHPEYWPIRPTDAIVVPGTDLLLVADGYGSSFIHFLNKTNGKFLEGMSFGGKGNATSPRVQFNTPHSVSLETRKLASAASQPVFIVSDRSNNRFVWVLPDGTFVKEKSVLDAAPLPCNIDIEPKTGTAIVPSLGLAYSNLTRGRVSIFSKNHELLSTVEVAELIGDLGHQHPHDAIWLPSGDFILCCWSGPNNPGQGPARGTISYWQRLKE